MKNEYRTINPNEAARIIHECAVDRCKEFFGEKDEKTIHSEVVRMLELVIAYRTVIKKASKMNDTAMRRCIEMQAEIIEEMEGEEK